MSFYRSHHTRRRPMLLSPLSMGLPLRSIRKKKLPFWKSVAVTAILGTLFGGAFMNVRCVLFASVTSCLATKAIVSSLEKLKKLKTPEIRPPPRRRRRPQATVFAFDITIRDVQEATADTGVVSIAANTDNGREDRVSDTRGTDCQNDLNSTEACRDKTEESLQNQSAVLDETEVGDKGEEKSKVEKRSAEVTFGHCPICLESLADRAVSVTMCGHVFCQECIAKTVKRLKICPTCRQRITGKKVHPIYF